MEAVFEKTTYESDIDWQVESYRWKQKKRALQHDGNKKGLTKPAWSSGAVVWPTYTMGNKEAGVASISQREESLSHRLVIQVLKQRNYEIRIVLQDKLSCWSLITYKNPLSYCDNYPQTAEFLLLIVFYAPSAIWAHQ